MFYALQFPRYADHPVTRYLLGLREEGGLARRRGLLPDVALGSLLAAATVAGWYLWNHSLFWLPSAIYGYPWRLVPLLLLFSPLALFVAAGFAMAEFAAARLPRDHFLQQMRQTDLPAAELLEAYAVGIAVRAVVVVGFYFQTLACLALVDSAQYEQSSFVFLLALLGISLFAGGAQPLDFAVMAALRGRALGRPRAVSLFVTLPLVLFEVVAALLFGMGVGGLAWLGQRTEALRGEVERQLFAHRDED